MNLNLNEFLKTRHTEIWKEIPDYPDYKVSNFGNIMSKKFGDWKKINPSPDTRGYNCVSLTKNKKKSTILVHRLLAIAFIPNPDNLPTVDHIDQNRSNNDLSNLRWASRYTQNMNTCRTRTDILETDPIERNKIILKESRQRAIDSKKYYCEMCNKAYDGNYSLQTHYKSKSHLKIINFKPTTKYFCSVCGRNCPSKSALERHMIGPKHKKRMENK